MENEKIVIFEPLSQIWWTSNLSVFAIILILALLPYVYKPAQRKIYPFIIGILLLLNLIIESLNGYQEGTWAAKDYLPFHLCSIASIIAIVLSMKYHEKLAQLFYYWGLLGAITALMSPVFLFGVYGYHYYAFYIAHGGILFVCLYMILHLDFRPMKSYWWKSFLYIQLVAIMVMGINKFLGANYMFLSEAPVVPNPLLQYPWPWYIITFEVFALFSFWALFILFKHGSKAIKQIHIRIKEKKATHNK
jgi:hypothetical integral membrane protein (TIGR02206 family)